MQPIPTYLWQSIVVTLLCCLPGLPAGVVAIVQASKVQSRQQLGDIQGALRASKNARTWCIISLALGLLAYGIFVALGASGAFDTETTYHNVGSVQ
jgi:hypothetical protein